MLDEVQQLQTVGHPHHQGAESWDHVLQADRPEAVGVEAAVEQSRFTLLSGVCFTVRLMVMSKQGNGLTLQADLLLDPWCTPATQQ